MLSDQAELEFRFTEKVELIQKLTAMHPADAVGVAVAYLMHAADKHPATLRLALRAPIEHANEPSTDVIGLLTHLTS